MPHALPRPPGIHTYLIRLEHGYVCVTEEIELKAEGPEVAFNYLRAFPNKRRAIMFEDGKQIVDLTYLEGYWQIAK